MTREEVDLTAGLHALAHPTRRAILIRARRVTASISALADALDITFPTCHKHICVLESAGLISRLPKGRKRIIVLEEQALARVLSRLLEELGEGISTDEGPDDIQEALHRGPDMDDSRPVA